MRNIKLEIEYDGSSFFGWQKQVRKRTVQVEIEKILKIILKEEVEIFGAGRTDSGVHALKQVANFHSRSPISTEALKKTLNCMLPQDISIVSIGEEGPDFHARKSAKAKTYVYIVNNSDEPSALNRKREYHVVPVLDIGKMRASAECLIGTHDFKGFMSSGSNIKNTQRTIFEIRIDKKEKGRIEFSFTGNGFLYNMIRILVGTLIEVGAGTKDREIIREILQKKDRKLAGNTAPPQGLYLMEVGY